MDKEKIIPWEELLPELTDGEQDIVSIQLSHPLVIKYFRSLAIKDIIAQVKTPMVDIVNNQTAHLVDMAYAKGRMSISTEIIDWAIEKQRDAAQKKLI